MAHSTVGGTSTGAKTSVDPTTGARKTCAACDGLLGVDETYLKVAGRFRFHFAERCRGLASRCERCRLECFVEPKNRCLSCGHSRVRKTCEFCCGQFSDGVLNAGVFACLDCRKTAQRKARNLADPALSEKLKTGKVCPRCFDTTSTKERSHSLAEKKMLPGDGTAWSHCKTCKLDVGEPWCYSEDAGF